MKHRNIMLPNGTLRRMPRDPSPINWRACLVFAFAGAAITILLWVCLTS